MNCIIRNVKVKNCNCATAYLLLVQYGFADTCKLTEMVLCLLCRAGGPTGGSCGSDKAHPKQLSLGSERMKCSCSWVSGAGGSWPQTRRMCTWLWASVGSYVSYRSENTQDKDGVQEGIGSAEPGASRATAVGDGYGRARRAGRAPQPPAVAMATRKPPGASPPPAAIPVLARLGRAGAARPRRSGPCSKEP